MSKYTAEIKLNAVERYLSGSGSYKGIAESTVEYRTPVLEAA
jgi:transposase-like protein